MLHFLFAFFFFSFEESKFSFHEDGQLESEAGDGMGFGMATFDVCNIGKTPANCPMPYCQWLHNSCVPGAGVAELQKTVISLKNSMKKKKGKNMVNVCNEKSTVFL